MSSVVKDNQVLASIPDAKISSPAGSTTVSSETSSRPQPVALEVAVTVNGARTVAGSDKREPFSESTKTVLIFGNGAVVRLVSTVAPGQLLFLTNEKTKKEVVCQVVKSKNYSNVRGYIELEFTEPVAGFWGMRFPAAAPSNAATTAPTPATAPAAGSPKTSAAPSSAARPSAPLAVTPASSELKSGSSNLPHAATITPASPVNSVPATSSQSSSHPIHSYSSTPSNVSGHGKTSNVVDISKSKIKAETPLSSTKNSAVNSKSILDSDEVKIPSWLEPLARNAAAASAALPELTAKEQFKDHEDAPEVADLSVTDIADTPQVATHPVAAPTFGAHFLSEEDVVSGSAATGGSSKKVLIAAIAAGILLVAGGGAWYVRQQNANSSPVTTTSSSTANGNADASSSPQVLPQTQGASSPSGNFTAVSSPGASGAGAGAGLSASNPVDASQPPANANKKLATVDAPLTVAAAQPKKPKLGEVNLSAPVVNRTASGQEHTEEALNLGSSGAIGGETLSSGLVANSRQPVAPAAPLPVGGDVKAARLISSAPPQYPAMARSQRVAGEVKLDALVDINGQVAGTKVISGPVLLQQPAMDAVRRWKYEPAQLNGKAVPMHLTVTVQFKLQ